MSDQWEYRFTTILANPATMDDEVNSMLSAWTAEGWEPVNHAAMGDRDGIPGFFSFLFKRRIPWSSSAQARSGW
ncbi:hypothetical protein [Streptomyces sp. NPDC047725]|uniref:hypothetical protein n=1 Tax=Streptomyces sp. NPDC047725 TaxID=3365487 RepID=UPI003711F9A5